MNTKWIVYFLFSLLVAVSSACGVGGRYGVQTLTIPAAENETLCADCEYNREVGATFGYLELRILDWTGLLVSGITTTGSADTARRQAVDDAVAQGAKSGDTVSYEYQVTPVMPGFRTELLLRFAGDEIPYEFGGVGFDFGERTYFGADLKMDTGPNYIGTLPMAWHLTLATRLEMYDVDAPSSQVGYGLSEFHIDLYIGAALNYLFASNLVARVEGDFGVISPLMVLLGFGTTSATAGAELNYLPFDWMTLQVYSKAARQTFWGRHIVAFSAGLGVTFQTPKDLF